MILNLHNMTTEPTRVFHTPYAFVKKTPKFAQGLDFLRLLLDKTKESQGKTDETVGKN